MIIIKIFILSIFPAPYRVGVFKHLSKRFITKTFFEFLHNENRNSKWFIGKSEFEYTLLTSEDGINEYKREIGNLSNYDFVLVYDFLTIRALKLMLKCILMKKPYVINCDGAFINKNPIKNLIKTFFIKMAKACLASGEHAKRYYLTFGAKEENIYFHKFTSLNEDDILETIISKSEKSKIKKELGLKDKKTAISIGQFIPRKGYDVLISAWKDIDPNYELIIIGGGEKEEEYIKQISENNLTNITLIGFKSKEEIVKYYKACDLFVLPTREDVWGLVINEAMAFGIPIITTDNCVAGLELIKDGINGYIVPVEDTEILAEKINKILADEKLCEDMGRKNLEIIKPYTIENIAQSHIELFEQIFNKNEV